MTARAFSLDDQRAFAAMSGDHNPLHVDPLAARRSAFGRPVVHGIHLALWALEQSEPGPLKQLSVLFRAPVCVGDAVKAVTAAGSISLQSGGAEMVRIRKQTGSSATVVPVGLQAPERGDPRRLSAVAAGLSGHVPLTFDFAAYKALLPGAAALPAVQLAILLATTRLVGMECPGLYSLYSELNVEFSPPLPEAAPRLDWRVVEFDGRFSRATIAFTAPGAVGTIVAFLRPAPQPQPAMAQLAGRVAADAFAARRALVIGGSRGLGELCAKLLASGGADVRLTYHAGEADAAKVVDEIRAGGGRAGTLRYDALRPPSSFAGLLEDGWTPTHVYYFPTPAIFVGQRKKFSAALFAEFCRYYVEGFYACWEIMRGLTKAPLEMFYPSSVAVLAPPPDMGEYAAAKAAGEKLCEFLAQNDRNLRLRVTRLPRLPSDQTASFLQVETADPVNTMLDVLTP